MSGRIVHEVLEHAPEDLTPLELLTLVALAEACTDRDRHAYKGSSTEVLARKTRASEGTMRNTLKRLRERGLIVATVARPNRGKGQNYYLPRLEPHHRKASCPSDANEAEKASRPNDANVNGKSHSTVTLTPVDNPTETQHA